MVIKLKLYFPLAFVSFMLYACVKQKSADAKSMAITEVSSKMEETGNTISTRFLLPDGFERIAADSTSFASHLRNLPLKPKGSLVTFYNGDMKPNYDVYAAVVDLPIGKRDLHQCADAVMRLRADYFFENKMYDRIHFNFTNGFKADYSNWRKGKRILVKGNEVSWRMTSQPSAAQKDYWKYLEMVFSYAGTASLEKEMKSVALNEMKIGDVFIKGGFPGHAVIVVDMAVHKTSGEKLFLLAQSYMPAQELQILKNPNNKKLNPWYWVSEISNSLQTPEWTFDKSTLKRFIN
jgi:hypothetical protein